MAQCPNRGDVHPLTTLTQTKSALRLMQLKDSSNQFQGTVVQQQPWSVTKLEKDPTNNMYKQQLFKLQSQLQSKLQFKMIRRAD